MLKKQFGDRLVVMAFPCNQFGAQEPKSNAAIREFTERRGFRGVVMKKCKVNGGGASPVFDFLKVRSNTGGIMWNFYKYVVAPDGKQVRRFTTQDTPAAMAPRHSAAALRRHGLRLRAALASWRGHTRQARDTGRSRRDTGEV